MPASCNTRPTHPAREFKPPLKLSPSSTWIPEALTFSTFRVAFSILGAYLKEPVRALGDATCSLQLTSEHGVLRYSRDHGLSFRLSSSIEI